MPIRSLGLEKEGRNAFERPLSASLRHRDVFDHVGWELWGFGVGVRLPGFALAPAGHPCLLQEHLFNVRKVHQVAKHKVGIIWAWSFVSPIALPIGSPSRCAVINWEIAMLVWRAGRLTAAPHQTDIFQALFLAIIEARQRLLFPTASRASSVEVIKLSMKA